MAMTTQRTVACSFGCALFLVFLLALSYGFGSPVHYSDPIQFKVIDEETGKPLEGVAVIAVWQLESFIYRSKVYKTEAVSDMDGDVRLEGMPMRIRPPLSWFNSSDPEIHIYKSGYKSSFFNNAALAGPGYVNGFDTRSAKRRSFWSGRTVAMVRDRTPGEYLESFRAASSVPIDADMRPTKYPKFWHALALGYQSLTSEQREHEGDPQETVDYWTKREDK
jgi:hypothetical protein